MSKPSLELAHTDIPLSSLSARFNSASSSQDVSEVLIGDCHAVTESKELSENLKLDESCDIQVNSTYLSERIKRPPVSERSVTRGSTHRSVSEICHEALPAGLPNVAPRTSSTNGRVTIHHKWNSTVQFLSLCYCLWLVGWNDGTTGPLLPRLQEYYKIGFILVSMIFVGGCSGYICAGILNIWLNDRLGFGKILAIGTICQLCGYAIIIVAPPFPLLVSAYVIAGFGVSLQVAQCNGFVASLNEHMTTKLGLLQGAYGLGAFSAPFSSTHFSKLSGRQWSYHFILSAAFTLVNMVIITYVFRFRRQDEVLLDAGQEPNSEHTQQQHGSKYRQIFSHKSVPLLAVFALIYIGVEVTLGGWIVTFIIRKRGGRSNSGYISSGFFGGLTLGRLCLMWLNKLVGEYRIVIFYAMIAIGLELTVWFVPNIIGNAVSVSLVGIVLGPMYPLLVSHMTRILPKWLLTGCVSLVTGIGVAGSAALPLITGVLASKYGIASVQPLMISMMSAMALIWLLVPKASRRVE